MSDYWERARIDTQRLGTAVRTVRQAAMMSQPELCALVLYLDVPTLSRIESGTFVPSPAIAADLSAWLAAHSNDTILQALHTPVARTTDPHTSHDAARTVTIDTMRSLHVWWLRHLDHVWKSDPDQMSIITGHPVGYYMTDEGARKYYDGPKVSDSGFRTRRAELRHAELVRDSGLRYPISTGRMAIAWELTPSGKAALKQETPTS